MAPGGVALVQDFLNTRAIEHHLDLLAEPTLGAVVGDPSPYGRWSTTRDDGMHPPTLSLTDVTRLRALRATIAGLITGDVNGRAGIGSVPASFALSDNGEVRLEPPAAAGDGWPPRYGVRLC